MSLLFTADQSEREILVQGLRVLDAELTAIQNALVTPAFTNIAAELDHIVALLAPPLVALRASAVWVFDPQSNSIKESKNMPVDMTDNQTALIGPVTGIDADSNPEALPTLKSPLQWALDDPTAGALTPSADSLSATFTPAKTPGHLGLQTVHYNTNTGQGDPDLKGVQQLNVGPGPITGLSAPVQIQGNP